MGRRWRKDCWDRIFGMKSWGESGACMTLMVRVPCIHPIKWWFILPTIPRSLAFLLRWISKGKTPPCCLRRLSQTTHRQSFLKSGNTAPAHRCPKILPTFVFATKVVRTWLLDPRHICSCQSPVLMPPLQMPMCRPTRAQ